MDDLIRRLMTSLLSSGGLWRLRVYSGATVILIEHAWPHSAFGNNITRQISPQRWYFAIPAVHRAKDNLGLATVGSNVETYRGYLLLPPGTARSVERDQQIGLG